MMLIHFRCIGGALLLYFSGGKVADQLKSSTNVASLPPSPSPSASSPPSRVAIVKPTTTTTSTRFQFVASWRNQSRLKNVQKVNEKRPQQQQQQQQQQKKRSKKKASKKASLKVGHCKDNFVLKSSAPSRVPISWRDLQCRKYFENSEIENKFLLRLNSSSSLSPCTPFVKQQTFERSVTTSSMAVLSKVNMSPYIIFNGPFAASGVTSDRSANCSTTTT